MKALTIWQPWATLIMIGAKPYEFRRWDFRERSRSLVGQRIVIHAGSRPVKPSEIEDILERIGDHISSLRRETAMPLLERLRAAHKCRGVVPLAARPRYGGARRAQERRGAVQLAGRFRSHRPSHVGVAADRDHAMAGTCPSSRRAGLLELAAAGAAMKEPLTGRPVTDKYTPAQVKEAQEILYRAMKRACTREPGKVLDVAYFLAMMTDVLACVYAEMAAAGRLIEEGGVETVLRGAMTLIEDDFRRTLTDRRNHELAEAAKATRQ
jgi:hypothetical protein